MPVRSHWAEDRRRPGRYGADTLVPRCGPAANPNIPLHCLVLDGVCRSGADGARQVGAPADEELHAPRQTVIGRLMKMLTRRGVRVEDMGHTWLAEPDTDSGEV